MYVKFKNGSIVPLIASGDYHPTNVDKEELKKLTDENNDVVNIKDYIRANDELLINASHELRTPLNIIYGAVQLLEIYTKNDDDESGKIASSINSIKRNSFRLMKVINNLLELQKIETGLFKINCNYINIVEVVEDVVQRVSEELKDKHFRFVFDTECEEKYMMADVENIERVLLNLLSNAVKFSYSEGMVYVYMFMRDNSVEIAVIDTGIGIEKKYLDDIFDRFGQVDKSLSRSAEGCGIGLKLSKSIIEAHGGSINVFSSPGNGSAFIIKLPCKKNDTIYTLYPKKVINDSLNEMIKIEFSDIEYLGI